jgi:chromate transporter
MNAFLIYALLLKATCTSFSGLASLPLIREDFVLRRHVLTDQQLNTAVFAGRAGPGPNGIYVVSVGYFAGGVPGAAAGLLAVITPAFLILPMMRWLRARAATPRVRSAIRAVILATAGLLLSSSLPLARDAVQGTLTLSIVIASFFILSFTRVDSAWVMFAAAVIGLLAGRQIH